MQKKLHQGENNLEPFLPVKHTAYEPSGSGILNSPPKTPGQDGENGPASRKTVSATHLDTRHRPPPKPDGLSGLFTSQIAFGSGPSGAGLRLCARALTEGFSEPFPSQTQAFAK
jgi:hypothetical protein